jgi:hypothetical protein
MGLPAQVSMSDVYKWLIYFKSSREFIPLSFINMVKEEKYEYRAFSEAELKFDSSTAELNFQGKIFKLSKENPEMIPQQLKVETTNFLLGLVQNG